VKRLAPACDVDLATDLPRLTHELAGDPRPARRELLRWLNEAAVPGKGDRTTP
jgi:hypothetical protein